MTTSIETIRDEKEQCSVATPALAPAMEDFSPGIEFAFPHDFQECDCTVETQGDPVPDFVRGTYYLNGPARFGFGRFAFQHWLDGDGMVSSLRFGRDSVHLKSRYIRSRKFEEEQRAGRPLFRTFGTAFEGSRLNSINNGLEFAAHPKFDPETGEMFNFGVFFAAEASRLYFYCFGPEGFRYRKSVTLEFPCSVHDFSLSKKYAVFYLSPFLLDITGLLQKGRTVMDSLTWEPHRGSRLLVLARNTGEMIASIPVGNRYCLHLINSFEEQKRLTVDALEFDEPLYGHYMPVPSLFQKVSHGGPVRFVIDLETGELADRQALHYQKAPDFPAIDPQSAMHSYNDFWMLGISATGSHGRKFFDTLVHATWSGGEASDIYQTPPLRYLGGEPVFIGVPGSKSGEGVVICQEFDAGARQSYFLLFDARHVAAGPITRMPLEQVLYLGFHAAFRPERQTP